MATMPRTKDIGLRGIPVADTSICLIDGRQGKLFYRGYNISDLTEHSTYEEVAYLLLYGQLPKVSQLSEFTKAMSDERRVPDEVLANLQKIPKTASAMDVLQSCVSTLAGFDINLRNESQEANRRKATALIAKIPTIVAAWDRIRRGLPHIPPLNDLSHAANFLYMLTGEGASQTIAHDFDVCLILHAEHSFNASTFTARVVASTRAHMYASVSAAVGALSGELHGGANEEVMRNLIEIGNPDQAENWVRNQLDRGQRVMGMGHAVYKTIDPRARILKEMSRKLARNKGEMRWFLITERIEDATEREFRKQKRRPIFPNVDLYSASVYYLLGIPPELYTPVFAIARVAGWSAHILEEKFPEPLAKPVLYRPMAEYQGNYCGPIGCSFVPIEERS